VARGHRPRQRRELEAQSVQRRARDQRVFDPRSNGIKYAPPGTAVTVRGRRVDGGLEIAVEDAHRGILSPRAPRVVAYL
jgi:signal transduction histidine kinase